MEQRGEIRQMCTPELERKVWTEVDHLKSPQKESRMETQQVQSPVINISWLLFQNESVLLNCYSYNNSTFLSFILFIHSTLFFYTRNMFFAFGLLLHSSCTAAFACAATEPEKSPVNTLTFPSMDSSFSCTGSELWWGRPPFSAASPSLGSLSSVTVANFYKETFLNL